MKTFKQLTLAGLCLATAMLTFQAKAQLPDDFITQVSYLERTEVNYSMASEESIKCLNLSELANYHGYSQMNQITEVIDQNGELFSEKLIIDETNVRDDWMQAYSKIVVTDEKVILYADREVLFEQELDNEDSENLTNYEAENYGSLNLDSNFYNELGANLTQQDFAVSHSGTSLKATKAFQSVYFDSSANVLTSETYNDGGYKTRQVATEFVQNDQGIYYPEKVTEYEWFLTKNGCCIRKGTITYRFNYVKIGNSEEKTVIKQVHTSQYQIQVEENSDNYRIVNSEKPGESIEVSIYDLSGSLLEQKQIQEGKQYNLPADSRWGMYLIYIQPNNQTKPTVGKIIHTNRNTKF